MNKDDKQPAASMEMPRETKLVQVTLSAYTRVEFVETIVVPVDINEDELNALANERYRDVDGGQYVDDPHYWERGEATAVAIDGKPTVRPTRITERLPDGSLSQTSDLNQVPQETVPVEGRPVVSVSEEVLASIERGASRCRFFGGLKANVYKAYVGYERQAQAYEKGWYSQFEAWCEEVNRLEAARCEAINATPGILFKSRFEELPVGMLRLYFDECHTPKDAHDLIVSNMDAGRSEALAS